MKEIPLTRGLFAIVDDEDYQILLEIGSWQALPSPNKKNFYAVHSSYNKNNVIRMNRFIMNTPKGMICDHINGNTLDNRKSNLRNCTKSQNAMNKIGISNTNYKNISINKYGSFLVTIYVGNIRVFRKTFKRLQEAIKARDEQLKIHHGEFAKTK